MTAQVGIVIPCFNDLADHVREAVESALGQDVPVDVVVVDDGSTRAETLTMLEDLPPSVKVIHTRNSGPAAARNRGVEILATEFVLPLDADDRISPNFARAASSGLARDEDVFIAYADVIFFGDATGHDKKASEVRLADILTANRLPSCSMFRRSDWERIGGYDESLRVGHEDYEFWVRLLAEGGRAVKAANAVFYHRIRAGSRQSQQGLEEAAVRATRAAIARNNPDHREALLTETGVALHLLNRENRRLRAQLAWYHRRYGWTWRLARRLRDQGRGVQ
ncbi:glycosyltransferase family 2 protein [Tessaracoccus flavus]|uniref:Uncharacterized protein n=1 Tax=Tessaracoccus flavus TaxID=1610493 RepID=A0A1Q2CI27_9ACTN|nr:glycosyltransferase family A protein [Tessaracoccus flavus]AQP45779.1 hypothetical protein RPIT_14020 [Tessaracoccus flavus]SDZ20953.1 Glycosyl transferase family 2 [Tessaracoccus flavus]